jgi:hypothetical protein
MHRSGAYVFHFSSLSVELLLIASEVSVKSTEPTYQWSAFVMPADYAVTNVTALKNMSMQGGTLYRTSELAGFDVEMVWLADLEDGLNDSTDAAVD